MKAKYEKMIDEYVKKHYGDLERGVLAPEVKYKVLTKILKKKLKGKKAQVKMLQRLLQGKKEIESWDSDTCFGCEHYIPMHPEGLNVIPASCKLGRDMAPCCAFYSVKADEIRVQKELFDLRKVCGNCIHFREGKGKDKSVCAKDDTFVTKNCSCYEFEDKDKEQKEMKTCDKCKYSTFKTMTNGKEAATGKLWCTKNDFETSGVTSCDWFEDKESSYLDWMHDDITWCGRECSDMDCERNTMNKRMTTGLCSMADMYDPFKCPVDAEIPEDRK